MKRIIYSIIFLLIFIIDFIFMKMNNNVLDNYVYEKIMLIKSDFSTLFFSSITFFGSVAFIICMVVIIALIMLFKKNGKYSLIVINSAIQPLILKTLKHLIKRERPNILRLVTEGGYSFPSGHALIAVLFYGSIIYYISKYHNNYKWVNYFIVAFIILIGVSRIYLGVHYFTDIVAGLFLGLAILNISIYTYERMTK